MSENPNLDIFKQMLNATPALEVIEDKVIPEPIEKTVQIKDERTKPARAKKEDEAPVVEDTTVVADETQEEVEETPLSSTQEEVSEIRTIAQHYAEKGILASVDPEQLKDLDDEEAFETIINSTVESKIAEYKEQIPEDARYLLEYLEQGGDPRNYVEMMSRPDYSKFDIAGDDNVSNQKRVLRDYLSFQDYTPEQIEKRIERYLDRGLLEEEAETALEQLVKAQSKEKEILIKQQQEQAKQAQKQYEEYLSTLKAQVTSKKDIAGFEIKPEMAKKLYEHMTKPVTKDGKTQFMLNYEKDPEAMLKVAYFDMIGWDFSKAAKQTETKVTKSLKDKLKSKDTMTSMKGSTGNSDSDNFSAFKALLK